MGGDCGVAEHASEGADSRLTATLQAILSASHYLDWQDSEVIDGATDRALDAAVSDAQTVAVSDDLSGGKGGWEGPGLAALSLLALLRVCKPARGEGIARALDVLQEMVRCFPSFWFGLPGESEGLFCDVARVLPV